MDSRRQCAIGLYPRYSNGWGFCAAADVVRSLLVDAEKWSMQWNYSHLWDFIPPRLTNWLASIQLPDDELSEYIVRTDRSPHHPYTWEINRIWDIGDKLEFNIHILLIDVFQINFSLQIDREKWKGGEVGRKWNEIQNSILFKFDNESKKNMKCCCKKIFTVVMLHKFRIFFFI